MLLGHQDYDPGKKNDTCLKIFIYKNHVIILNFIKMLKKII